MENPYGVDESYGKIAANTYTEQQLIDMGCLRSSTGHYLLISSRLSGLDLVFEKNERGLWELTTDNKGLVMRVLSGIKDTKIMSRDEIQEATYFIQIDENKRRRKEREMRLKPGELIHRRNNPYQD
ncbi:hypothetical protein J4443_01675 [Candidatus Woesearchaeota archaeon]|nr:hypothetical protein [Candidatus Woesearchaeota archaeon]